MITYWHNPRCSKSREGLKLLEDRGAALTLRRYLEDPPRLSELRELQGQLGLSALEMMRTTEPEFKALGLSRDSDEGTLLRAMAEVPKLIERPIAIQGNRAVIGRPPERVLALLR